MTDDGYDRGRWLRRASVAAAAAVAVVLASCGPAGPPAAAGAENPRVQGVEPPTLAVAMARLPEFSMMRTLSSRASLGPLLANRASTVTVLAPRDTAFAKLPPEARAAIAAAAPGPALQRSLRGLIIPRVLGAEELRTRIIDGGGRYALTSLAGTPLTFQLDGDQFIVAGPGGAIATMGSSGLTTGNGTLYVLDTWIGTGL